MSPVVLEERPFRWSFWPRMFLFLAVFAVGMSLYDWIGENERNDFTRYSLAASRVLYDGGSPYDKEAVGRNYKYCPFNAVILGPFLRFPIPVAQGVWTAINLGLLIWLFRLHWLCARPGPVPWWAWFLSILVSIRFMRSNLDLGQWNTSVYCLAFAGLFYSRRRPWLGGALLGLATVIKYMPAFFLLFLLARRKWKAAAAMILAVLVWALVVPTAILGPRRHSELMGEFHAKGQAEYAEMTEEDRTTGQSLRVTIYSYLTPAILTKDRGWRTINVVSLSPDTAQRITLSLMALFLAAAVGLTAWRATAEPEQRDDRWLAEVGLWFMLLLIVTPEARKAHFLTIFTPTFALCLALAREDTARLARRFAWTGLVGAGVCFFVSFSIVESWTYPEFFKTYGSYGLATAFLAAGCAGILLPALGAGRSRAPNLRT